MTQFLSEDELQAADKNRCTVEFAAISYIEGWPVADKMTQIQRSRRNCIHSHIIEPYAHFLLKEVTNAELLRQNFELHERSSALASRVLTEWRAIFKMARMRLWIPDESIPTLKLPRHPKPVSPMQKRMEKTDERALNIADLMALFDAAKGKDFIYLLIALGLALRPQEARGALGYSLELDHKSKSGALSIEAVINSDNVRTTKAKTDAGSRKIEFGLTIYTNLLDCGEYLPPSQTYIFGGESDHLGKDELNKWFGNLCIRAGVVRAEIEPNGGTRILPKCSVAMLRRAGASVLYLGGTSLEDIRTIMGHQRDETSFSVYLYDPGKVGSRKPPPTVVARKERSFFSTTGSSPVTPPSRDYTRTLQARPSKKLVSRAVHGPACQQTQKRNEIQP